MYIIENDNKMIIKNLSRATFVKNQQRFSGIMGLQCFG